MNWKKVKVGDFLIRVKDLIAIEKDNEYSLVTIKLYHKGVQLRKKELGANISADKMSRLKAGQFILSGIDARNGAFGIVPSELDGAVVTNDFWHFDIDESIISKEYFLWLTSTPFFDDICKKASDGTTNRIRLQADRFYTQELVIPSIENQHEVVVELKNQSTKIFTLQNAYTSQLTQLTHLNQAILQEAVQGKLVPQDPNDEPASELLKRIKLNRTGFKPRPIKELPPIKPEEIPFEIPSTWVWCRLGEIANHSLGKMLDANKNKGELKPYLRNINVQWFNFDLSDIKQMKFLDSETKKYSAIKGDILICEGGYPGRAAIWGEDDVIMFQKALHRVRFVNQSFNEKFFVYYLYLINGSDFFKTYLTGSGIQHFTGKKLNILPLPLPPLSEQKRIVAEIERQMTKTQQLKEHVLANQQATEQLLKALLHQAFEGEAA